MDYARVLHEIFNQIEGPKFSVRLWSGQERCYGTGESSVFTLIIDDAETVKRLLGQGSLGFGESYMEGRLRIEGNLEAYLRLRHRFKQVRRSPRLALATFLARVSTSHDRKKDIAYHYDLGNDFFQMILDNETMSYSAGRYETGSENLVEAQKKKLALVCKWLDLPRGASILDLGSGWGGFAEYAAANFGWRVTGYTLSNTQLNYSQRLVRDRGLANLVTFEDQDMVHNLPRTEFDGVVVLESIEHVGKDQLVPYLASLRGILKLGAPIYIQLTGRYKPRPVDRWTLKYVFPGGYLPAKNELLEAASQAGLMLEGFRDDTSDYLRTMQEWIRNLESHRTDIENAHGKPFYRMWELWMHGAHVSFEVGAMNLFRVLLRRPLQ